MVIRSILKVVSVWCLLICLYIFSIYGVKGLIIEIRKFKLYFLFWKKFFLYMINFGWRKFKYLFLNKILDVCFGCLIV